MQSQRVIDKDTLLVAACDPKDGKEWLLQVDLNKEALVAKRAEVRKK